MATSKSPASDLTPLLTAMLNMTAFHREHEKFYSTAPAEQAVTLQRHSRTLHALADQWTTTAPSTATAFSPYEGAPDLNAAAALQLDGVLFMEGGGEPGEIHHLKRDLRTCADDAAGAGEWLATAMKSSWDLAFVLLEIDELADLLGERHRIIANNWQGASIMSLAALIFTAPPICSTASTSPPLLCAPTSLTGTPRHAASTPPRR